MIHLLCKLKRVKLWNFVIVQFPHPPSLLSLSSQREYAVDESTKSWKLEIYADRQ